MLARVGIRVSLAPIDFPSLIARIARTFDYDAPVSGGHLLEGCEIYTTAEVVLGGSLAIPAIVTFFGISGAMAIARQGSFDMGFISMPLVFNKLPGLLGPADPADFVALLATLGLVGYALWASPRDRRVYLAIGAVLASARHFGRGEALGGLIFAEIKVPVPLCDGLVVKKGSKIFFCISRGMPGPVSRTSIWT